MNKQEAQQFKEIAEQAHDSLEFYHNNVFPLGFTGKEKFSGGAHMDEWCRMLQDKKHTCILAPRKHSKSYTLYSWLQWLHLTRMNENLEILYLSFKQELASYHIGRYKRLTQDNPWFSQMRSMTPAEGIAKWMWPNKKKHTIIPEGILSFKRGRHPDIVILDDCLADPTTMLDLHVIEKINNIVKEDVMSLPKEGGNVKIIGTAQTPIDFFFDMKRNPEFTWGSFPAVKDWKQKIVLWPQKFPWDRLMHIRDFETGEKGFQKEYMIEPVWSADAYFNRQQMLDCINDNLRPMHELQTKNEVGAGWDIGKHRHPAHFTVFEFVPIAHGFDLAVQRMQVWMDGWEYKKQLEFVKSMIEPMRLDYINWDATRGELEGFWEKNEMDKSKFFPVNFTSKMKNQLATQFEKRVTHHNENNKPAPLIQLLNDQRQLRQLLTVTNDLQAIETHEGHGEPFWSVSMALHRKSPGEFHFLSDPDNVMGLQ